MGYPHINKQCHPQFQHQISQYAPTKHKYNINVIYKTLCNFTYQKEFENCNFWDRT
jgi:hypothetical protein